MQKIIIGLVIFLCVFNSLAMTDDGPDGLDCPYKTRNEKFEFFNKIIISGDFVTFSKHRVNLYGLSHNEFEHLYNLSGLRFKVLKRLKKLLYLIRSQIAVFG